MKKILLLSFLLFISAACSHINQFDSLTKDELIEKLIVVNQAEAHFYEAIEKTMQESKSSRELTAEGNDVIRKYCTWESWKPYYVSVVDETYTRDELKGLIRYWTSLPPDSDRILKKQLDEQVKMALTRKEWEKEVWMKMKPALHDLPRKVEKQPATHARIWKSFSDRDKLIYIKGVLDGSHTTKIYNLGELSLTMDALYEDAKNQDVTYPEILRLAEQKLQDKDIPSAESESIKNKAEQ